MLREAMGTLISTLITGLPAAAFEGNSNVSPARVDPSPSSARVPLCSQGQMPVPHRSLPGQHQKCDTQGDVSPAVKRTLSLKQEGRMGASKKLLYHPHKMGTGV